MLVFPTLMLAKTAGKLINSKLDDIEDRLIETAFNELFKKLYSLSLLGAKEISLSFQLGVVGLSAVFDIQKLIKAGGVKVYKNRISLKNKSIIPTNNQKFKAFIKEFAPSEIEVVTGAELSVGLQFSLHGAVKLNKSLFLRNFNKILKGDL